MQNGSHKQGLLALLVLAEKTLCKKQSFAGEIKDKKKYNRTYRIQVCLNKICGYRMKSKLRIFFVIFRSQWHSFKSAEIRLTGGN